MNENLVSIFSSNFGQITNSLKYPVAMKRQQAEEPSPNPLRHAPRLSTYPHQPVSPSPLVVVGSAAMDITSRARKQRDVEAVHFLHSTVPGSVSPSPGGVGRNITEATHRILSKEPDSHTPVLVSLVGEDIIGRILWDELSRIGMRTDGLILDPLKASAMCNMVVDTGGGLITGVADMHIIESLEGKAVSLSILHKSVILSTSSA